MPQDKHYVVFVGRVPRIYRSWPECQRQVIRFSENFYHSYPIREEAAEAFEAFRRAEVEMCMPGA